MKYSVDIHTILSTPQDMDDVHDLPDAASDKLNTILHMVYDAVDEEIVPHVLERMLSYVWEHWHQDKHLSDIELDDLVDWVDHLVNNWESIDDSSESLLE